MKKLIFDYLFKNYYWLDNKIWSGPDEEVSIRIISDDLVKVFGLTEKQTKWYLKSWCERNPKFNFKEAWGSIIRIKWKTVQIFGSTQTFRTIWTPDYTLERDHFEFRIDAEGEMIRILTQEVARTTLNEEVNS